MSNYYIAFDRTNSNNLIFKQEEKEARIVNCPPTDNNCDIINLGDYVNPEGHKIVFSDLLLITDMELRQLFYKGKLVDMIHRKTQ